MARISSRIDDDLADVLDELDVTKSDVVRRGVRRELRFLLEEEDRDPIEIADEIGMDQQEFAELLADTDLEQHVTADMQEDGGTEETTTEGEPETTDDPPMDTEDVPTFSRGDIGADEAEQLLEDLGIEVRAVGPAGFPIPRGGVEFVEK